MSITSCASRRNEPTAHGENRISNVVSDEGASVPDLGVTAKTPSDASSSTSHSYGNGTSDRFATATVRTDAQPGNGPAAEPNARVRVLPGELARNDGARIDPAHADVQQSPDAADGEASDLAVIAHGAEFANERARQSRRETDSELLPLRRRQRHHRGAHLEHA